MVNELITICRQHFQFGWTGSTDIANSVAMETLALPNLLVVNATSYQVNIYLNRLYQSFILIIRIHRSIYKNQKPIINVIIYSITCHTMSQHTLRQRQYKYFLMISLQEVLLCTEAPHIVLGKLFTFSRCYMAKWFHVTIMVIHFSNEMRYKVSLR